MRITVVTHDPLTPKLRKLALSLGPDGRRGVLRAMGTALVAFTQEAFRNPANRPLRWDKLKGPLRPDGTRGPPRDGTPLLKTRMLMTNIHIAELSDKSVSVAAAQDYGVHHQFGAPKAKIPPRPFFPFHPDGRPFARGEKAVRQAAALKLGAILRRVS